MENAQTDPLPPEYKRRNGFIVVLGFCSELFACFIEGFHAVREYNLPFCSAFADLERFQNMITGADGAHCTQIQTITWQVSPLSPSLFRQFLFKICYLYLIFCVPVGCILSKIGLQSLLPTSRKIIVNSHR